MTSSNLLLVNPEYYPAWNYRKRELQSEEMNKDRLEVELELTMNCIRTNPKSYAAWYHRQWIIKQLSDDDRQNILDINFDLKLIEKLLNLDSRNFHCWNYRLFLLRGCKLPLDKELEFTTRIIRNNFSNRSAWHYRSIILKAIYESGGSLLMETMDADFDLIRKAIWTSPSDETPWKHYRWLIDHYAEYKHHKEPSFVSGLVVHTDHVLMTTKHLDNPELCKIFADEQECKYEMIDSEDTKAKVLKFERPVHLSNESKITIACDHQYVRFELGTELAFAQSKKALLSKELANINELLEEEPDAIHANTLAKYIQSEEFIFI